MQALQQDILRKFIKVFNNPPLREMARLTGITLTRSFRLMNGYKMKLEEYQTILKCIQNKIGSLQISSLATNCEERLGAKAIEEMHRNLSRRLRLWELAQYSEIDPIKNKMELIKAN